MDKKEEDDELNYSKEQPMAPVWQLYIYTTMIEKIFLCIGTFAAMCSGVSMPLFIVFLSDLYDSFSPTSTAGSSLDESKRIALIFIYIGLAIWVVNYLYLAIYGSIAEKAATMFRLRYLESVLKQEIAWFEINDPQSLSSRMNKEITAIQAAAGEKMATIIMALTMTLTGFIISFSIGWSFSLVCCGLFPFFVLVIMFLVWTLSVGYKKGEAAFKKSSSIAEQALSSIKIVVAYGQEVKEGERFEEHLDHARIVGIKFHFFSGLGYALNNSSFLILFTASLFFGSLMVTNNVYNQNKRRDYTGGDIVAIFFGIIFGAFSLGIAAPNFKSVTKGRQALKCVLDIINREPEIKLDDPDAASIANFKGEVELKNVSFKYRTRKIKALDGVNLKFERGKVTALVGPSGSGKSTIVQLLERFYDPEEGEVLIDGLNFKNINLREFRSRVGYVGQEPVLFNQTIRENLLYGNPNATEEQIMKALKNANALKVVEKLPEGLETVVGAGGGQLSGGEKQRIALARAFVKDPKILILDEATSALDRKNEKEVQEAIDSLQNGEFNITTIVIAHRLSTVRNSDKIIVLKEGQIVEEGNHKSLLKEHPGGIYSTLVAKQEELEDSDSDDDNNQSVVEKKKSRKDSNFQHKSSFGEELKNKKEEADQIDKDIEEERQKLIKQLKKRGFFCRLLKYNKPYYLIFTGLICSAIQGMSFPVFGIIYVKTLFGIFIHDQDKVNFWLGMLLIVSVSSFIATYFQKVSFGVLAENMTKDIRKDLYQSIIRKHIGWFDHKDNNIGALTSTLTSDVYALNGASTEGLSALIETMIGLIGGLIIGLCFEWRTSLCCAGFVPLLVCASAIQGKLQTGFTNIEEGPLKEAHLLLSDSISNYKTVSSFAQEKQLIDTLEKKLDKPMKTAMCKAHFAGIIFGYSSFAQNVVFAIAFWLGAVFMKEYGIESEKVFIAIFVIMFAGFGAGSAQQFSPSTAKAFKSAIRIFSIIDEKSDICIDDSNSDKTIASDSFIGEIEFKNVWFRYPTRPESWILKDFSLKIKPKEHVALVGESGSGKSTIVQLLYRFYEPHFGTILIDGINIKDYDIVSLRRQLSLVQQMPTLFNESVQYNICYGQDESTQEQIIDAIRISNADGFVSKLSSLEGKEDVVLEEMDEDENVSDERIIQGFDSNCGVNGGKLSGGQKQRIAIARAVMRTPKILLLDEATSALDEVSQGKVQKALEKVMKGRTSIVIAHRLTTIENADRIIILKNGKIYKEGKFKDLKEEL